MKIKCDNCDHKQVCIYRPPEEYPQFMKRIVSENCRHYVTGLLIEKKQEANSYDKIQE